jgi:hypothetical protein
MTAVKKPILVTGSHRSGTTWAGQMVAAAPHTAYIHKPLNPVVKFGAIAEPFKNTF